ncbi:MAG: MATE family efflux transporter [Gudongella sp.]|nr:MATE family efflux transporter [Gudongella sp.]
MSNKEFGIEKISKLLFKFSIPVILSMLVGELYSMVDTYFIGQEVGGLGIGALISVFPLQRILTALSIMIAVGTATAFSRYNGDKNIGKAKAVLQTGFSLVLTVMLPISALIFFFKDQIISIMGAGVDISNLASTYLGIIIFGTIFLSMTVFISHNLIALGNTKISIIATSIGALINIILDYILVKELGMGISGAAIATASSQAIAFIYAFYQFTKMRNKYGIALKYKIDPKFLLPIVMVGLSAFVIEAEDGILMGVMSGLLTSTAGDQGLIILGVVSKLYMFLFITMFGIAAAMQPIVAYNFGARNFKRLGLLMKKTILYSGLTTLLLWVGAMIYTPNLIGIFVNEPAIVIEATKAFRIMISLFPIISIYYVSIFYFQARGRAKTSLAIALLRQLGIMLPVSILLVKGFGMGAMGVWIAYPISDLLASIAAYMLIRIEREDLSIEIKREKAEKRAKGLVLR